MTPNGCLFVSVVDSAPVGLLSMWIPQVLILNTTHITPGTPSITRSIRALVNDRNNLLSTVASRMLDFVNYQ